MTDDSNMQSVRLTCVVLTSFAPVPKMGGSSIRIASTVESLAKEFDVLIICSDQNQDLVNLADQYCRRIGIRLLHDPDAFSAPRRSRTTQRIISGLGHMSSRLESRLLGPIRPDLATTIRSADLVWIFKLAPIALCELPTPLNGPLIVDIDDIEDRVISRDRDRSRLHRWLMVRKIRLRRNQILRSAHTAIVCSSVDASRLDPICAIEVLPNTYPAPLTALQRSSELPPKVVVIGVMKYRPNHQGVQWFLDSCWNQVRHRVPTAQLVIAGVASDRIFHNDSANGISVLGAFDDPRAILEDASVVIVPVHYGSGTRVKILEALSFGVPVVSTSAGAEGIGVVHRQSALIADTPHEFFRCVVELLEDQELASTLSIEGRKLFESRYSPEIFSRTALAIARQSMAQFSTVEQSS